MKNLGTFVCVLAAISVGSTSNAQSLTSEDVDIITDTANVICNELQTSGSSSTIALSAEVEAEARLLLRRLGGGSADLDVTGFVSKFDNVSREDLKDFLLSAQECRLEVFRELRTLIGAEPQEGQLIWQFSHVVRDDLALGVVNVRAGGSGVDINWRLRNVAESAVYVKFGGSSYVDNSGNVCQRGSLTTSVKGIPFGGSEEPLLLGPDDSIQFVSVNVRCDDSEFTDSGDILATILVGSTPNSLETIRYEIAQVNTILQ